MTFQTGGSSVDGGVGFASMQQDSAEGLEIPFELQVVEAALQETVHQLEERLKRSRGDTAL